MCCRSLRELDQQKQQTSHLHAFHLEDDVVHVEAYSTCLVHVIFTPPSRGHFRVQVGVRVTPRDRPDASELGDMEQHTTELEGIGGNLISGFQSNALESCENEDMNWIETSETSESEDDEADLEDEEDEDQHDLIDDDHGDDTEYSKIKWPIATQIRRVAAFATTHSKRCCQRQDADQPHRHHGKQLDFGIVQRGQIYEGRIIMKQTIAHSAGVLLARCRGGEGCFRVRPSDRRLFTWTKKSRRLIVHIQLYIPPSSSSNSSPDSYDCRLLGGQLEVMWADHNWTWFPLQAFVGGPIQFHLGSRTYLSPSRPHQLSKSLETRAVNVSPYAIRWQCLVQRQVKTGHGVGYFHVMASSSSQSSSRYIG